MVIIGAQLVGIDFFIFRSPNFFYILVLIKYCVLLGAQVNKYAGGRVGANRVGPHSHVH